VRTEIPHEPFDRVKPWPYNINWTGGRSSWFENLNYTDLPLNVSPPEDVLQQMENVVFLVSPPDPAQLWRDTAYDHYDGSSWSKTLGSPIPATSEIITRSQALAQGNPIYHVYLNLTAGPNVGSIELPTLFPTIQVIAGSFGTGSMVSGTFQPDSPSRLLDMRLETDSYGTLLLSPLLRGQTGTSILFTYEVTYRNQDLANVAANARQGQFAPAGIAATYSSLAGVTLTQRVLDEIAPFDNASSTAYETAQAVSFSFRSKYDLMMGPSEFMERPAAGQEVTDWFIQRGGGLPMDFATAYCVFMRHLSIPARVVIGYAVGDPTGSYRTIRVRHMMFWAEVFIPMYGSPNGGEWIQVLPIPLPISMGGGETPQNTDPGNVRLYVGPAQWAMIGDNFNLSAILLFQGVPVTAPETILFRDETDAIFMGTAVIQMGAYLPLANITYAFPVGSTLGYHLISATWSSAALSVTNYTVVSAVGNPNPMARSRPIAPDFSPSEVVDLDIKLGLDNYTAHWQDVIRAHGVMTVSGQPVNGSMLNNNQMQVMWDEGWIGNATIGANGYYRLNISVNPNDLVRMKTGAHKVWAQYAGEWNGRFPVLLPARSADNSTLTVWGIVGFSLTVNPQNAYRGSILVYDGIAQLLNGTRLAGKTIGIFLNRTLVNTAITNSTGGFRTTYTIPPAYPIGIAYAQVNWTSTMNLVSGNWSNPVTIRILAGGTLLSINSTPRSPQVIHIYQSILIYGYLVHATNGSGIIGQTIRVYWQQGASPILIGNSTTGPGGYYQLSYTVPAGYEGIVTYWTQFNAPGPPYVSSRSVNMTIRVQKWAVQVSIQVDRNPVHLLETVTVSGNVSLPENGTKIGDARVTIWWSNSTGLHNLTVVLTSPITYLYTYSIPVSLYHKLGSVGLWAQFVSSNPSIASNESVHLSILIVNYDTTLTVFSDKTSYHLNETVHIWGRLIFENGSPWSGRIVSIYWNNGSVRTFSKTTNTSGWYSFYYNCSVPKDAAGTVGIQVSFTSPTPLYDNATAVLTPSITLQLYQVTLSTNPIASQYHLDEVIVFSGSLFFQENGAPLAGATVTVYYKNATNTYLFSKWTSGSGSFVFRYNCSINDALGAVYIWARYTSSNPLWSSAQSANRTATLILYQFQLTADPNTTVYHLNETVRVTGRLTYLNNGTPLAGRSVSVFWNWNNGTVRTFFRMTNVSGWYTFYYNCSVLKDRAANVTIWAEFNNTVRLWSNASSTPRSIQLVLYRIVFSTSAPLSVSLDQAFVILGNLTYAGGTPVVASATVSIYLRVGLSWSLVSTSVTNSVGSFTYTHRFSVPPDVPRIYIFRCDYTRTSLLTSNATIQIQVDAQVIHVVISVNAGISPSYLGQTFTVNGILTFENTTGMVGYTVTLVWDSGSVNRTISTGLGGAYSFSFVLPWNQHLGLVNYYVAFTAPTAAYENAVSNTLQVDVYVRVQLHLDSQSATVAVVSQSFTVNGFVTDGGGQVPGVPLAITVDSTIVWGTVSTRSDGTFSLVLVVPPTWSLGQHIVSLRINSGNYQNQTAPDFWTIEVHMGSSITVAFVTPRDSMPGESFDFTMRLEDSTGSALAGTVSLYLNSTLIGTRSVSGTVALNQAIPTGWTSGSGLFILSVRYSGAGFIDSSVGETVAVIHVFTTNVQFGHETPSRIDPNSTLTIKCLLTDNSTRHFPIVGRTVVVHLNSTGNTITLTTGADGRISYPALSRAPRGFYEYYITLVSSVANVDSDKYRVDIQVLSGPPLDVILMVVWTAAIVTEVIVAYVVIRRYRPSTGRMTKLSGHRFRVRLPKIRSKQVVTNARTG